ncbi:MAG: cbb3-type cytochrome oxidase assembly protein CcoS [Phycisphaerales bacterium]
MEVIAIVLPLALLMGGGAVWLFVRCVRAGQYDDLDTPPVRMLFDDDATPSMGDLAAERKNP